MRRTQPLMRFGRYRGRPLRELPDDYLSWLGTLDLREPLRTDIDQELVRRAHDARSGDAVASVPASLRDTTEALVTAGYRALARRAHPDAGGDDATMRDVNAAVEVLRRLVRGAS
jgi:hypothetical protein